MFCSRCGEQLEEGAKFCQACGQKIEAPVIESTMQAGGVPPVGSVPQAGGAAPVGDVSQAGGAPPADGGMPAGNTPQTPRNGNKKIVLGVIGALAAVAVIIVCVNIFGNQVKEDPAPEEEPVVAREEKEEQPEEEAAEPDDDAAAEQEPAEAAEAADEASDETSEQEIMEVLTAYQKYADEVNEEGYIVGFQLAYLDEDDVPELIAIGNCEAAGQMIIAYQDGELKENYISRLGGLHYVEKQNFFVNSNGHMGGYYDIFYKLVDGEQVAIASGSYGDKYDEEGNYIWDESGEYPEQEYFWNDVECSEEEYYEAMEDFIEESVGDAEFRYVDIYGEKQYFNMLEAYEALKIRIYEAYWPEIREFDLNDGILTFTVTDGERYGWQSNYGNAFSISCPVAPDCIWENRGAGSGQNFQPEVRYTDYIDDTDYEEIREWIESERAWYDEAVAEYGEDEIQTESPVSIHVVVKEGVVVRVYTVIS